jgi:hypothetical protein
MITAVRGFPMVYVSGRRREIVAAGPRPGRTPTIVPSTAPIRAKSRLTGVVASANPCSRNWNASMDSVAPGSEQDAGGQPDF